MQLASPGLRAAFAAGATIIAPNQLLASVAHEQFVQTQLAAGLETWLAPQVLSVNAWLSACWREARYARADVPPLLSLAQERAAWEQLIQSEHPRLFDHGQAVSTAIAATRVMAAWNIPSEGESWHNSSDTRHFQSLLRLFRKRSKSEGWITRSDLWPYFPHWMDEPWWPYRNVTLAGFPYLPPALQQLPKTKVLPIVLKASKKAPVYTCQTLAEEVEQAARWARRQVERNPKNSIGILIADLPAHKHVVARTFRSVFYSGSSFKPPEESIYHLGVPEGLNDHPLVASALLLLQLALPRIPIANAGAILRSPFLAGATAEQNERATADLQLRRRRDLDVTLADLERSSTGCRRLSLAWSAVRRVLNTGTESRHSAGWSEFIGSLLAALGWPGDGRLTSHEQQIVEDWKASLSDLAALGFVGQTLSYGEAIAQLQSALESRSWQTGDFSSPVQIVDASAAYGIEFAACAVCNMSEETWPPPVRSSPFLPFALQRGFLASESELRDRKTAALFFNPKTIAFASCPLAPAAKPWTEPVKGKPRVWSGLLPRNAPPLVDIESLADSQAPPFTVPGGTAPGGVSILKSQSQCPFQAFATYRLAAKRPEDACFGFDARDRGSFLHHALEQVWLQLRTREQLRSTGPAERRALVSAAVTNAVGRQDDSPFHQLAGQAERERLEELIMEWLVLEERREQAFTVEQIEKSQTLALAGLPLSLRLDRVDRLANGSLVLIDYKSGEPKLKSLEGDRPSEPQLLVYAAAVNEPVDGTFFAQIRPRNLRAIGISRTQHFPKRRGGQTKVKPDWDQFLNDATTGVESIASEFLAGQAIVDPQKGACTWCNLKPLCRVNEGKGESDEDDAD